MNSNAASVLLSGFLMTLLLNACGGSHGSSDPGVGPGAGANPAPLLTADQLATDPTYLALGLSPLTCQRRDCPLAVGQLITKTFRGLHLCTATLVAPNIVLTASHCVPWESVLRDQSVTGGGCWFRTPHALARCLRVVQASHLSGDAEAEVQSDYAYIEIAPGLSSSPLRVIDQWNGRELSAVKIWVARVSSAAGTAPAAGTPTTAFSSVIREISCRREKKAELSEKTWQSDRARVFSRCEVQPGDSGGPLVDARGVIHGVLSLRQASKANPEQILTVVTKPEPLSPVGLKTTALEIAGRLDRAEKNH